MGYYVVGSQMSYSDYLTHASLTDQAVAATGRAAKSITGEISRQTRELIASRESLSTAGFTALESASREGFELLSHDLSDVIASIDELGASLDRAMGQLLGELGRMHDTLAELLRLAQSPAQAAAYEQFEIARDAFRRHLWAESLEALDAAIAKYKLEWRFHHLRATLLLGFRGGDIKIVDLPRAEEAFRLAARYAAHDAPREAGIALLSAGWAAYCQGHLDAALVQTRQATEALPRIGEAVFQEAKILVAAQRTGESFDALSRAIDLDPRFILKAAADGDFQRHEGALREFIERLRRGPLERIRHKAGVSDVQRAPTEYAVLGQFLDSNDRTSLFDLLRLERTAAEELDRFIGIRAVLDRRQRALKRLEALCSAAETARPAVDRQGARDTRGGLAAFSGALVGPLTAWFLVDGWWLALALPVGAVVGFVIPIILGIIVSKDEIPGDLLKKFSEADREARDALSRLEALRDLGSPADPGWAGFLAELSRAEKASTDLEQVLKGPLEKYLPSR